MDVNPIVLRVYIFCKRVPTRMHWNSVKKIHTYIDEHGYGDAVNFSNSLMTMYLQTGRFDKACEVLRMRNKNVVSWSSMISSLAMNGRTKEAIKAFRELQKLGVQPDDQTFRGVLSACSHCGLVDAGLMFFDCMSKEFGIVPNIHHYGCMVDLLGRAGLLYLAYQLIMSMGVKPDLTMWRTLLGACRIHGHVTIAEQVIGHLVELKAQEKGDYALLLSIYHSAGNLEKVMKLRKYMKKKALQTTPGCGTIVLNRVVHEFVMDDFLHPQKDEVHAMVDEINQQLNCWMTML
ncbi:pentatricopeptide repeat-containing protein At3g47530-like [Quercus robur]|uniref:pentatricopeptide repeat-containing protein At3g47530-like n=1 Tax=Quercus robur TaxID=38942 RepID=UPI002162B459|nr:pentatricopeptide repeat-containing protein At3g47530-like [Quercus robur]